MVSTKRHASHAPRNDVKGNVGIEEVVQVGPSNRPGGGWSVRAVAGKDAELGTPPCKMTEIS